MRTLVKFLRNIGILIAVVVAAVVCNPLVVTSAREYSLIVQFGKVVRVEDTAGPSLKIPFLQTVQKIPRYKMIADLYPSDVTTKDKKVMTVDSFVIWEITDPVKYLSSLSASREKAEVRLDELAQEMEEASSDYLKLQDLYAEREKLEDELAHLYTEWEKLAAELEEARG